MAVALMTRGPLTAYSIFLMQGFMLSSTRLDWTAVDDIFLLVVEFNKLEICLKPFIVIFDVCS
jgi:hypothetical protein